VLGTTSRQVEQTLSAIQAVLEEERDVSQLKLVVCGSAVAQMEALQSERNPLHVVQQELREPAVHFAVLEQPCARQPRRARVRGAVPRARARVDGRSGVQGGPLEGATHSTACAGPGSAAARRSTSSGSHAAGSASSAR
jgi:hypothetical protein